jgi:hypothetical protein
MVHVHFQAAKVVHVKKPLITKQFHQPKVGRNSDNKATLREALITWLTEIIHTIEVTSTLFTFLLRDRKKQIKIKYKKIYYTLMIIVYFSEY